MFQKVEKKNSQIIFIFYPTTLNITCFFEKKKWKFCLCIFESDTVKSDSPMQDLKI